MCRLDRLAEAQEQPQAVDLRQAALAGESDDVGPFHHSSTR
jgi:hypothetical protein